MKICLTGATGFVGKALIKNLLSERYEIKAFVRQPSNILPSAVEQVILGDLTDLKLNNPCDLFTDNLKDVEVIVHTAARVHIMNDTPNSLNKFRKINRDATMVIAGLAAKAGVKRFIFLSSVKVNGELTLPNMPFKPDDIHIPEDPYSLSKYEAERGLLNLAKKTRMEIVIIRPPLVYGPGVKGNFDRMMRWMNMPVPLPFGAIHNQRSLVALDNLVSFICLCVDCKKSSKASNQVFLISDGQDVSTTQLLKKVRRVINSQDHLGVKACLVPVPVFILVFFAKLFGKGDKAKRLFGSLQVDNSKIQNLLGWQPIITMDEQLAKMSIKNLTK